MKAVNVFGIYTKLFQKYFNTRTDAKRTVKLRSADNNRVIIPQQKRDLNPKS